MDDPITKYCFKSQFDDKVAIVKGNAETLDEVGKMLTMFLQATGFSYVKGIEFIKQGDAE